MPSIWKTLFRRSRQESEMSEEIAAHIENRAADLMMKSGLSREQAVRRARLEFGGIEKYKENCREARGFRLLHDFIADLRFTFRLFRKSIGFSLVAVSSLALGIGASSAIFSLIYAVLIDPYPYKNSDRIITPAFTDRQGHTGEVRYTISDFLEIKKHSTTLEDAFLGDFRPFVATHGLPVSVNALAYSPNAFDFMGVPPILGRTFAPQDIPVPSAPPNIGVIGYLFWQRYFNRDPRVAGKTIELNHQVYTILGVLPPRYTWRDMDIYVPLPMLPDSSRPIS